MISYLNTLNTVFFGGWGGDDNLTMSSIIDFKRNIIDFQNLKN